MDINDSSAHLYCCISGQVESGNFPDADHVYCTYSFSYGLDWKLLAGLETGLSQTAAKSPLANTEDIVWNFPIDATFKSTNIFGWPRLAIGVYGLDFLGRDVARGYASVMIPLTPGVHTIEVTTFVPLATSFFNEWASWFMGNPPEFFDSKFVCQGEGREVTRVRSTGTVKVKINVITKNMNTLGYSCGENNHQ